MRSLLPRLAALAIGLLLALVLAEVALRVFEVAPTEGVATVTAREFERVPGLFGPGQSLVNRELPALPFRIHINDLGYRGSPFPRKRPAHEARILMVGDSFTYGDFVEDGETLPARVEAGLRRACGPVTVINAGVGGSTIVTHTHMVRRGLVLDPQLVILTFSENDVFDLANPMWDRLADNRRLKSRPPLSIVYPVLRHTASWNFALRVRARVAGGRRPDAPAAEQTPDARREAELRLRGRYAAGLAALRDELSARGLPLAFAIYPSHHSVASPERPGQLVWVEGLAGSLGLPTVDLLEPLQGSGLALDDLYLLPHDGHPGPRGYALAAQALLAGLRWPDVAGRACRPGAGSGQ